MDYPSPVDLVEVTTRWNAVKITLDQARQESLLTHRSRANSSSPVQKADFDSFLAFAPPQLPGRSVLLFTRGCFQAIQAVLQRSERDLLLLQLAHLRPQITNLRLLFFHGLN